MLQARLCPARSTLLVAKRFASNNKSGAFYSPSFVPPEVAAAAAKQKQAEMPAWSAKMPSNVTTFSPTHLHPSQQTNIAPVAREAKKQILALVQVLLLSAFQIVVTNLFVSLSFISGLYL
jgi:hypothetical protein